MALNVDWKKIERVEQCAWNHNIIKYADIKKIFTFSTRLFENISFK